MAIENDSQQRQLEEEQRRLDEQRRLEEEEAERQRLIEQQNKTIASIVAINKHNIEIDLDRQREERLRREAEEAEQRRLREEEERQRNLIYSIIASIISHQQSMANQEEIINIPEEIEEYYGGIDVSYFRGDLGSLSFGFTEVVTKRVPIMKTIKQNGIDTQVPMVDTKGIYITEPVDKIKYLQNILNMNTFIDMQNKQTELQKALDSQHTKGNPFLNNVIIPELKNQVIHYVFKNAFINYDNSNRAKLYQLICENGGSKILGIPMFKPDINITLFTIPEGKDIANPEYPRKKVQPEPITIYTRKKTTNIYEILFLSLFRLRFVHTDTNWYYYMPVKLFTNYRHFIDKITGKTGCKLIIPDTLNNEFKEHFVNYIKEKQQQQKPLSKTNPRIEDTEKLIKLEELQYKKEIKPSHVIVDYESHKKNIFLLDEVLSSFDDNHIDKAEDFDLLNKLLSKIINFICFFVGYLHNYSVETDNAGSSKLDNNPIYYDRPNTLKQNVILCKVNGKQPKPVNNSTNPSVFSTHIEGRPGSQPIRTRRGEPLEPLEPLEERKKQIDKRKSLLENVDSILKNNVNPENILTTGVKGKTANINPRR